MRIDAWSDVVCPWCAIGKAHLEAALSRFEHADEVEVVWRSFELDPGAPAVRDGDYAALLAKKYGASPAGGAAMVRRLSAAADAAGIPARFDRVRPASTFDAHRVLHLARELGRQGEVKTRLLRAYLVEGEVLSDPATLVRLATEAGLPPERVEHVVASTAYAEDVRADEAEAAGREVTAVPTFVLDGLHVVPGAQSADTLLSTLRRVRARSAG